MGKNEDVKSGANKRKEKWKLHFLRLQETQSKHNCAPGSSYESKLSVYLSVNYWNCIWYFKTYIFLYYTVVLPT